MEDQAPNTYHIILHDYDGEDRACYRAFIEGWRACDVSAYDSMGAICLEYMSPKGESKSEWMMSFGEARALDYMLIIDTENEGHAWCGNREYMWVSREDPDAEYPTDYIMDFTLID